MLCIRDKCTRALYAQILFLCHLLSQQCIPLMLIHMSDSLPSFFLFILSLSLSLLAPCWSKKDSHELQLFTDNHLSSMDLPDSEKAKRVSVLSVQFLSSSYLYLHYSPPFHSTIDRCQSASLTPLKRACKKVMWIHLMRTSLTHHRAW